MEQNVAFGLRMQKVNADDSQRRVAEVLKLVELNDFAARSDQLSVASASVSPWPARW